MCAMREGEELARTDSRRGMSEECRAWVRVRVRVGASALRMKFGAPVPESLSAPFPFPFVLVERVGAEEVAARRWPRESSAREASSWPSWSGSEAAPAVVVVAVCSWPERIVRELGSL